MIDAAELAELTRKAGKLTRAELEAERDSSRSRAREAMGRLGAIMDCDCVRCVADRDLSARISKELGQ